MLLFFALFSLKDMNKFFSYHTKILNFSFIEALHNFFLLFLACQVLIETAAKLWQREEGDYRDDVRL